jgi:2-polyprenyl-3-methyl-5-hydroxy-6-metoxy-1,4-benzoquinol methylase
MSIRLAELGSSGSDAGRLRDTEADHEKRQFYERLPSLPIPLDRGRIAKAWLPARAELLDIGCSAGYHVRHLARKAKRVVAIDVDRVALAVARRRVKSSRVTFLHYDGRRLPFADASFDAVSMLDVLEHVQDRAGQVAEIVRVLRPGGVWTVTVPYRGALGWLSPENMAADYPRLFAFLSRLCKPQVWIRSHNATGDRHHHFSINDLKSLVEGRLSAERAARRGSIVYAFCYVALCFPPRLFSRVWTTACFTGMAADYQVSYGPLAYNLAMQFRKPMADILPLSIDREIQRAAEPIVADDRTARAA